MEQHLSKFEFVLIILTNVKWDFFSNLKFCFCFVDVVVVVVVVVAYIDTCIWKYKQAKFW